MLKILIVIQVSKEIYIIIYIITIYLIIYIVKYMPLELNQISISILATLLLSIYIIKNDKLDYISNIYLVYDCRTGDKNGIYVNNSCKIK